eukprot:gene53471-14907_t
MGKGRGKGGTAKEAKKLTPADIATLGGSRRFTEQDRDKNGTISREQLWG